ncbi:MAG: OadG family protein [Candidatus Syntropharchaeia archaeon]
MIDWTVAGEIAVIGFTLVFIVLGILAAVIWAVGKIIQKTERGD